jgi:outer membrane cobalamin receptor
MGRWAASCALGIVLCADRVAASEPGPPAKKLEELTLVELMNVKVQTPTKTPQPLRESPGVVTVITREEIRRSGARELMDVLHLVPGFAFGVDVQGVVGLGFRGNWGHEGKVLLLLDGQELNETLYSTTQWGNHLPVDMIQRIEIIRGPGSAIYGGYAGLAVINIVTRRASDFDGSYATATAGQMEHGLGRRNLSYGVGHASGDFTFTFSGFAGHAKRSDRLYRDVYGEEYRLTNANLDPQMFNLGASYKRLEIRLITEHYRMTTRDSFGMSLSGPVDQSFSGLYFDVRHPWNPIDKLTLTPRFQYKRQLPWRVRDRSVGAPIYYDKMAERFLGGVTINYDVHERVRLLFGAEYFTDRARLVNNDHVGVGLQRPLLGPFHTLAGFSQLLWDHSVANLSAGLRYERNSRFGSALLPRLGLTKHIGRFHAKLLYAHAFRAPGHENYAVNPEIRPEHTTTWELETGYAITDRVFVGLNLFDITIRSPIIYSNDPSRGVERYFNADRAGSRGLEAEVRVKNAIGDATLRYSFYTAEGKNNVGVYAVPERTDVVRALPAHKVTLHGTLNLPKGITFNPSVVWLGPRYGTIGGDPTGGALVGTEKSTVLVNFFLAYPNFLASGLELGAGVHNVLNQELRFLQPYDAGHAPLPGPSREYLVRLSYELPFATK